MSLHLTPMVDRPVDEGAPRLRALTLPQPLATAVVLGRVSEVARNRTTLLRGFLLIHAGPRWDESEITAGGLPEWLTHQRMRIIGGAELYAIDRDGGDYRWRFRDARAMPSELRIERLGYQVGAAGLWLPEHEAKYRQTLGLPKRRRSGGAKHEGGAP